MDRKLEKVTDELLHAAVAGNTEALSTILEIFDDELATHLTGRIARIYQSVLSVDDVLQITYLEVFLRIHQFRPGSPQALLRWLKSCADHNLIDAIRLLEAAKRPSPKRAVAGSIGSDSITTFVAGLVGTETSPLTGVGRADVKTRVETALNELPPVYAKVIRLYDLEGRSIADVCERIGRSSGAVHMIRNRAHDRMRELLGTASKFFSSGA